MSLLRSVNRLYVGLQHLVRLFQEARGYQDLEIVSCEKSFTLPLPSKGKFLEWILKHTQPFIHSLHIVGKNADSTKTIRADFLLSELPFDQKDVGVKQLRATLDRIHEAHTKDKIEIVTSYMGKNMVQLAREMEVTLICETSLTPDASKYLHHFKTKHRRMTIVELSLNNHLRAYLLDHPLIPKVRRLNKAETNLHTPKLPLQCNELFEDSVEVLLIGGVPGDMIESKTALKTGVTLTQYWKIIANPKKKKYV